MAWSATTNHLIVRVNQAMARLQQGALDEAIVAFKEVLQGGHRPSGHQIRGGGAL
jgi:hypothetical protein